MRSRALQTRQTYWSVGLPLSRFVFCSLFRYIICFFWKREARENQLCTPAHCKPARHTGLSVCPSYTFVSVLFSMIFNYELSHQRLPQRRELSPQATEGVRRIKLVSAKCTIDTFAGKTPSIFFLRPKTIPALFFPLFLII